MRIFEYFKWFKSQSEQIKISHDPAINRDYIWYSTQFTPKYWLNHYMAHARPIDIPEHVLFSATFDLTMLYMTQSTYSNSDFSKIKRIIKIITNSFLKQELSDLSRSNIFRNYIFENIAVSYILGFIDLTNQEKELIFQFDKYLKINSRNFSYHVFPYFRLLFNQLFRNNDALIITLNNIDTLRSLFLNEDTIKLVNQFLHFCKENKFGLFQFRNNKGKLDGTKEYRILLGYIINCDIDFLDKEISDDMFNDLLEGLTKIREMYKRAH